jgi:hypothetical protein
MKAFGKAEANIELALFKSQAFSPNCHGEVICGDVYILCLRTFKISMLLCGCMYEELCVVHELCELGICM